jgi:hypothetical protein
MGSLPEREIRLTKIALTDSDKSWEWKGQLNFQGSDQAKEMNPYIQQILSSISSDSCL